jgi:hypothetical protein
MHCRRRGTLDQTAPLHGPSSSRADATPTGVKQQLVVARAGSQSLWRSLLPSFPRQHREHHSASRPTRRRGSVAEGARPPDVRDGPSDRRTRSGGVSIAKLERLFPSSPNATPRTPKRQRASMTGREDLRCLQRRRTRSIRLSRPVTRCLTLQVGPDPRGVARSRRASLPFLPRGSSARPRFSPRASTRRARRPARSPNAGNTPSARPRP